MRPASVKKVDDDLRKLVGIAGPHINSHDSVAVDDTFRVRQRF